MVKAGVSNAELGPMLRKAELEPECVTEALGLMLRGTKLEPE